MKKKPHLTSLFLLLFINTLFCQSRDSLLYFNQHTFITIDADDSSFRERYEATGVLPVGQHTLVGAYFGELSEIESFEAKYKDEKGKWKSIKSKNIISSDIHSQSFYNGYKKKTIVFPEQNNAISFSYSYTKKTSELKFLAGIQLRHPKQTQNYLCQIDIPNDFKFSYKLNEDADTSEVFKVTTTDQPEFQRISFEADEQTLSNINHTLLPGFRCNLSPRDKDDYDSLNDWYYAMVLPKSKLNPETIADLEKMIDPAMEDREKIKAIFKSVQKQISYIDFENGLGAIQPRDVNQIWLKKQGDCKDMSNLICQSLKHLGFESYMALSATLGHRYDFDFPSISSANHAICVVKYEDQWFYLDATSETGIFGQPSSHIQDRSIFIINEDQGEIHKVEALNAIDNQVKVVMNLEQNGNGFDGDLSINYKGLSRNSLLYSKIYETADDFDESLQDGLEEILENVKITEAVYHVGEPDCQIQAAVKSERNISVATTKSYLSLNFLPYPHPFKRHLKKAKDYITYRKSHREIEVNITLKEVGSLKPVEAIVYDNNGMRFEFEVTQVGDRLIQVTYRYINEHLIIKEKLSQTYNEINTLIKKTLSKTLIYEKSA